MRIKCLESLQDLQEGMYVTVVDKKNAKSTLGYILKVKRAKKVSRVGGKPAIVLKVYNAEIEYTGAKNSKIILTEDNFAEYHITCRTK